ncbi:MAG: GNAT family N-acetyltransferase [Candidatus Saccharimonadales bacterium]
MPPEWLIEPLDRKRHERKSFDCGTGELNNWLIQFAGQYEERDLARTYVATLPGDSRVVGYYSVCSHHVQFESVPQTEAKGLPKHQHVPVVLLGKLAVCTSVQGRGLGAVLLFDALRLAEHVSRRIGARAVEVDAIDSRARNFYLKHGFAPLADDPEHLFMAMRFIRKLNLPPWTGS